MDGKDKILDQLKKKPLQMQQRQNLFWPADDFTVRGPAKLS
jgi:hypothetical protein